jgi:hypothetical protein
VAYKDAAPKNAVAVENSIALFHFCLMLTRGDFIDHILDVAPSKLIIEPNRATLGAAGRCSSTRTELK